MACLLDTTAYTHLNKGSTEVADIVHAADRIYLTGHVVAELKYGLLLGSRTKENEAGLQKFLAASQVAVLYADETTNDIYAALAAYARGQGKQLSHNDVWIASLAVQHQALLVTYDKNFAGIRQFGKLQLAVFEGAR